MEKKSNLPCALALLFACAAFLFVLVLPGCKPEELGAAHPTVNDYYDKDDNAKEPRMPVAPKTQSAEDVAKKSEGCMTCHKGIENPSMHESPAVKIGCVDCHGGNALATTKEHAHVQPRGHWYHQEPRTVLAPIIPNSQPAPAAPAAPAKEGAAKDGEKSDKQTTAKEIEEYLGQFRPVAVTARPDATEKKETGDKEGEKPKDEHKPKDDHKPADAAHAEAGHAAHDEAHGGHGGGHGGHGTSSANPRRTYQAWMMESPEFVRFINPGDLRVAKYTCGECHSAEVKNVPHSMMAHGGMLWGAALYNNGAINQKHARFGEAYTFDGQPARLQTIPAPTPEETRTRGILPFLDPLPRYNITQSGNVLRAFERGGRLKLETALQDKDNEPGKPEFKLSIRGYGTSLSTDPVFLGLQKTRLLDPMLWQLGTNDQSGDYRSSGCSACHVIYANDRDKTHSGPWAEFGRHGQSFTKDEALKSIVGKETGHPVKHGFTKSIPSSQCVVCHMHPGTTVTMTYYGNLWWDNETEGGKMYPKTQKKRSEREELKIKARNPEGSALRGMWGDQSFLESLYDINHTLKQVQFADYHGHGWAYRNVYKIDHRGNLLDKDDKVVPHDSPDKFKKGPEGEPIAGSAVHMQDIHQEKGMHCIDCHFNSDNHGNGKLYGEVRNATEIMCADCHGTIYNKATLKTSGNAAPDGGTDLSKTMTPFGRRFKWEGDQLIQQSAINKDVKWVVKQTIDSITPGHANYNEKSRLAKTIRRDNKTWGDVPKDSKELAHQDEKMDCYVCHTSWMASCFGCHLPMKANQARENQHFEGAKSRNWTQYNFQTLREDVFMLGLDGTVKKNKVAPVRSACAVIVGSQNAQRENIYSQQQTISAEGFSGQAFSPHFPHSVRSKETRTCTDCHVSADGANNARMAQTLMQGTNQTNFMYRYLYTANGKGGLNATVVTERDEPQAVIGSTLHRDAYPEEYAKHVGPRNRELEEHYHHDGEVYGVQLRGEYVYTARGKGGLTIYDVAAIDNKGFSERIITAPVSPLGQRFYVKSQDCTSVISPTVLGVDPTRQPPLRPRNPMNQEQPISLVYAFLYCTDREEGLFTVNAATLLDGDPTNNFLRRHMTFNPGGILAGAVNGVVAGNYIYICADAGLVVIDISKIGTELAVAAMKINPDGTKVVSMKELEKAAAKPDPELLKVVSVIPMNKPKAVRIQFRYAFVVDADGLKVVDVTDPAAAKQVEGAFVPFKDARNVYVSRTHAYVAAGCDGVAIVDIEKTEKPVLEQTYNADGKLNDVYDVKVGMTNASVFAYVANGEHGLSVVQLTSPETVPGFLGWIAKPTPTLIATKHLHGKTLAISEGLQRDRGVDESGNQLSVFNRVGSRPFNKAEMEKLYKIDGKLFTVTNEPPGPGREPAKKAGAVDPALTGRKQELEEEIKREKNPAKKKKLAEELEEVNKKIEEQSKAGGGPDPAKVQALEEEIKRERNPAKKKKLQEELEELKKSGGAPDNSARIKELEEEVKRERNPAKKKKLQEEIEQLKTGAAPAPTPAPEPVPPAPTPAPAVPAPAPPTPAALTPAQKAERIYELEDALKRERNPLKKKALQDELDALKK